jgi:anti-sigma-K factor RskA
VAVVNRGGDAPALIIRVDLASGQVFVRPVSTKVPTGKSLELWYIGAGKAPRSMGLVDGGPLRMTLPEGARVDKASFAVTVEPEGGSPTGGPTGPIVYSGQLIKE